MDTEKKEVVFADGMFFSKPKETAPEFIKGEISIQVTEFTAFLKKHENGAGYVNLNLKKSKGGKLYIDLNSWEAPKKEDDLDKKLDEIAGKTYEIDAEDIPFN